MGFWSEALRIMGMAPPSVVAGVLIFLAFSVPAAWRIESKTRSPQVWREMGVQGVGKSTTDEQFDTPNVEPSVEPTTVPGQSHNVVFQYDSENEDTKRTINLRDPTGQGWIHGEWKSIIMADGPKVINYIIDHRALDSMRDGSDRVHNQLKAFEHVVDVLTSKEYQEAYPTSESRVRHVAIWVNKTDEWGGEEAAFQSLIAPFRGQLRRLTKAKIPNDHFKLRADRHGDLEKIVEIIVKKIEMNRHPWKDLYLYWKCGLSGDVRRNARALRRHMKGKPAR